MTFYSIRNSLACWIITLLSLYKKPPCQNIRVFANDTFPNKAVPDPIRAKVRPVTCTFWQKHVIPSESLDHTTKTETLWKSLHTLSLYHHHRQRLQMHKGSLPVIDKSFIANRKPLITNVTHNKAPKFT